MKARIGINPVAAVSGLLLSLMLAACGGGGGAGGGGGGGGTGGGGGQQMNITPGGNFYGALDWGSRGQYCDSGWAVGVATGYASRAAARAAAIRQCRSEGGTDCGPDVTEFGSAYSRGNQCVASAFGRNPSGGCGLRTRKGRTSSAAESAALAECRSDGFSCRIVTTACSTSGPAASYSRRASGGSGGPGDGGTPPVVTPPVNPPPVTPPAGGGNRSYGEFVFSARSGDCSDGYALGVATGHSTVNGARAAARNRCESAGGRSCGSGFRQFGSAYSGGNQCAAVAHGWNPSTRLCHLRSGNGSGTAAAESAALSACRAGGYSCAVAASACSTSGVESSDQGTGSFNGGGAPTVVTPPVATPPSVGNRRPVVAGGFRPGTVRQGRTVSWSISGVFSDPDGDRLTYGASSSDRDIATARYSGGRVYVTGGRDYTGTARITVTATDPGRLTATTTFSVRVTEGSTTGSPGGGASRWAAIAVDGGSGFARQNCTSRAAGWISDRSSRASAQNAAVQGCRNGGGTRCVAVASWANGCGAYAEGQRCGGGWSSGFSTGAAARSRALAECASQTTGCRVFATVCTPNSR